MSCKQNTNSDCSSRNTGCYFATPRPVWNAVSRYLIILPEICFRNQPWRRIQLWLHSKRTEDPTTWENLESKYMYDWLLIGTVMVSNSRFQIPSYSWKSETSLDIVTIVYCDHFLLVPSVIISGEHCNQFTFEHACTESDASEGESCEDEACISLQRQQIFLEGGGPETVALARTTIWDLNKLCRQVC